MLVAQSERGSPRVSGTAWLVAACLSMAACDAPRPPPPKATPVVSVRPTPAPGSAAPHPSATASGEMTATEVPVGVESCTQLEGVPGCPDQRVAAARAVCIRGWRSFVPAVASEVTRCLQRYAGTPAICSTHLPRDCVDAARRKLNARLVPADGCDPVPPCAADAKPSEWIEACNEATAATLSERRGELRRCMSTACNARHCSLALLESPAGEDSVELPFQRMRAVVLSDVKVEGGAILNAASVVARMRGRMRRCYASSFGIRGPGQHLTLEVALTVAPSGTVQKVKVRGDDGTIGAAATCMKILFAETTEFAAASTTSTVSFTATLATIK